MQFFGKMSRFTHFFLGSAQTVKITLSSAFKFLSALVVPVTLVVVNMWWATLVKNTLSGRLPLLLPCSKPWFLSRSLLVLCCQRKLEM